MIISERSGIKDVFAGYCIGDIAPIGCTFGISCHLHCYK